MTTRAYVLDDDSVRINTAAGDVIVRRLASGQWKVYRCRIGELIVRREATKRAARQAR